MIRINGNTYEGQVVYNANYRGDVSATFIGGLEDSEIFPILSATEISVIKDDTQETLAVYSLVKWRAMEKVENNLVITWQTYVINELDSIKQDNEDLTQAVLELAEIVGGSNNG